MSRIECKATGPEQPIVQLSGGNQQKIAIARLLHQEADLLLLDEPTRGIDIGTKAQIYRLVAELAAQGKAIILVSSYLPELMNVCDRIGVMCRGRLREVRAASDWTEEEVMQCATGTRSAAGDKSQSDEIARTREPADESFDGKSATGCRGARRLPTLPRSSGPFGESCSRLSYC